MTPAPSVRPPDQPTTRELLDAIGELRRWMEGRFATLEGRFERLDDRQRKQGEDLAELKGRVSQLPTLPQIISTLLGIFAGMVALAVASVALIRWAGGA